MLPLYLFRFDYKNLQLMWGKTKTREAVDIMKQVSFSLPVSLLFKVLIMGPG